MNGSLKYHIKTVHNGEMRNFSCQFCSNTFTTNQHIKRSLVPHLSCPRQKLTIVHGWAVLPLARLDTSSEGIWRWGRRKNGRGSEESHTASLPWSSVCITLARPANSQDTGFVKKKSFGKTGYFDISACFVFQSLFCNESEFKSNMNF